MSTFKNILRTPLLSISKDSPKEASKDTSSLISRHLSWFTLGKSSKCSTPLSKLPDKQRGSIQSVWRLLAHHMYTVCTTLSLHMNDETQSFNFKAMASCWLYSKVSRKFLLFDCRLSLLVKSRIVYFQHLLVFSTSGIFNFRYLQYPQLVAPSAESLAYRP